MESTTARRTLLFPSLVAALALAFTIHPIDDFDVWYHLAAGRLMWTTWQWPSTNTLAFTAPDHPWIDLHWMFQLLLYGAHALGGPNGCIALAALLILATCGWLYANARRSAPPALVAALLAVALAIASPRFEPRPELVSFVLLAVYLWLLDGYPRCGRAIYLLVPLQMVWTNAQGIFAVGLAVIGCYWLGATLAFLPLPRGWREASALTPADWRRLTLVLGLAAAVCFINPYGIEGVRFPLQLLPRVTGASIFSQRIGEFRAPFRSGYAPPLAYAWAALMATTALSFLANPRRWHLGRLLASAALAWLSTQAQRNMALFAWIAVPVIAANAGALLSGVRFAPATRAERRHESRAQHRGAPASDGAPPRRVARLAPRAAAFAVAAAMVVLVATVVSNRFSHYLGIDDEFGLGVSRLHVPTDAVDFMQANGVDGRPFNCLVTGGYLAWRLFPERQIFVDGRLEAYPEEFFATYFRTLDDPQSWPLVASRYGLDYALLYHRWSNRIPLTQYLSSGHGWTMVYYDEIASLFVRDDEAHSAVRERATRAFAELQARRAAPPARSVWSTLVRPVAEVKRQTAYGEFLRSMGKPAEAALAFERALALDPDVSDTRFKLGVAHWFSGKREQAIVEWRDLLRRDPSFERARAALTEVGASTGP